MGLWCRVSMTFMQGSILLAALCYIVDKSPKYLKGVKAVDLLVNSYYMLSMMLYILDDDMHAR